MGPKMFMLVNYLNRIFTDNSQLWFYWPLKAFKNCQSATINDFTDLAIGWQYEDKINIGHVLLNLAEKWFFFVQHAKTGESFSMCI